MSLHFEAGSPWSIEGQDASFSDGKSSPLLDKRASSVTPASESADRRRGRRDRRKLSEMAGRILGGRTAACGRRPLSPRGICVIHQSTATGSARFDGVTTCGSVWACPMCAAKISEQRRQAVEDGLSARVQAGETPYMAAFTIPHHKFQHPKPLRKAVSASWRKLVSGAPWQRAKACYGLRGWIRALEVTYGDNGWHPHLHVIFLVSDKCSAAMADELSEWLYERWAAILERGDYGIADRQAFRFERVESVVEAGAYVAKWGAAHELVKGSAKRGKAGRTPWQLLADARRGDDAAAKLFELYARAFKGARQLTSSQGLFRGWLDDQEIAETPEPSKRVVQVPSATVITLATRNLSADALGAVETGGLRAFIGFLQSHGISADGVTEPQHRLSDSSAGRSNPGFAYAPEDARC